jgi:hypothetical protein
VLITFSFTHKVYPYKKKCFEPDSLKPHMWNKLIFDYLTPEVRRKTDKPEVYFRHRGNHSLYIDGIMVEVFEPKK